MEVKAVLFGLLLFFFILTEAESGCNYFQILEPTKIYYAYNPEYPNKDNGVLNCTWQTTYPYVTKVNCTIDISVSANCTQGSLSIQFAGEDKNKYCGSSSFVLEGKDANLNFNLSYKSQGKFLCDIRTEEKFDEYHCKCGWKKVTRIVGGNETEVNEFPMMAGLVDSTNKIIYCGSTIISSQYVLTAAHCIEKKYITNIGVVVGEHDVTTGKETNATKLFRVSKCIMHPNYDGTHNDIAVCKIIGTIEYSAEVGPVCLPFQHRRDSFGGAIVTALGWGLMEFGGKKATTLQKVKLNVINLEKCKESYPTVNDKNICTFTYGKDTCQMDSGGPAIWENPTTHRLVLVGVTSAGTGCASNKPAIDERVGYYLDWLENATGVQYCKVE